MRDVVLQTFRATAEVLAADLRLMHISRWNESVFRYFFCRCLAETYPEVEQFVECDKIDLVLARPGDRVFIEFKFYLHPPKFDPYDGRMIGFKGGPTEGNLREFRASIDKLHARPSAPGLSKYVVLVYADPTDERRPNSRYEPRYGEYQHATEGVPVQLLDSVGPIEGENAIAQAKLYSLG